MAGSECGRTALSALARPRLRSPQGGGRRGAGASAHLQRGTALRPCTACSAELAGPAQPHRLGSSKSNILPDKGLAAAALERTAARAQRTGSRAQWLGSSGVLGGWLPCISSSSALLASGTSASSPGPGGYQQSFCSVGSKCKYPQWLKMWIWSLGQTLQGR